MGLRIAILTPRLVRNLVFGTFVFALPPGAVACGYHDDVSLARGVLNWVYPDALHVVGAVAQAVSERRLPAPVSGRSLGGLVGYHGTLRSIEQYAQQLRMLSNGTRPPAFSLLLIEPMLWTRFASENGDLRTQVHASGPHAEDLVVITAEEVIREVTRNRLTLGEAHRLGLIRLYGKEEQMTLFLTLYNQVGRAGPE